MKSRFFVFMALMAGSMVCSAKYTTVRVTVKNESKVAREKAPVVLKLKDVAGCDFDVRKAYVMETGSPVVSQLDDMDGNYEADEVFWLTDLKGREKKTFEVTLVDDDDTANIPLRLPMLKIRPQIWTALQLRDKKDLHPDVTKVEAPGGSNIFNDIYMHGITLESDLVGFRIYFDARQNIDLYGKRKRQLEIATTQFYTSAEQLAEGYGTDVLWAGKAIGCGTFRCYEAGEPVTWDGAVVGTRGQRIVTTGPLRSVVEVYDLGVKQRKADGQGTERVDIHQYYTLYGGHRDLKVDVYWSKAPNMDERQYCTGVQKVGVTAEDSVRMGYESVGMLREDGIAASWGCDYPDMGKKALWGPEAIGMAVYVPKKYIREMKESELNYMYVMEPVDNELHYWTSFGCAKEEVGYKNSKEWFDSMKEWKESCEKEVKVRIEK